MKVIVDSLFTCPGSVPIWGRKKGEFRDWTSATATVVLSNCAGSFGRQLICGFYSLIFHLLYLLLQNTLAWLQLKIEAWHNTVQTEQIDTSHTSLQTQ